MKNLDEIVDNYMRESTIDYVGLWQVAGAVRRYLGARTTEETRKLSLDVVRRLYERGLRPGDYWGGPFDYWPDDGCQAALDRIEREWVEAGADPDIPLPICWFAPLPR
jgi:hypothetical protein